MKITDLTLQEKILQTVVIRVDKDKFVSDQVGAAFFFGEIITEADEMGIDQARSTLAQYIDNAKIPILITSDFENGCGSMLKGLTPLPYLMSLGATNCEEIAYNYGKATALEARSVGANWSFSPVSDLNINKRNPLINVRDISDNPELAAKLLEQAILNNEDISANPAIASHAQWAREVVAAYPNLNAENAEHILQQEIGKVFLQVLTDAGVYKRTPDGMKAFNKFINTL